MKSITCSSDGIPLPSFHNTLCRADYADVEYIQELIAWQDPDLTNTAEVIYTEVENMAMLRLPRKERERHFRTS